LVEQRLSSLEIGGIEALSEPSVEFDGHRACLTLPTLHLKSFGLPPENRRENELEFVPERRPTECGRVDSAKSQIAGILDEHEAGRRLRI
jgi:hypothetical protein